MELDDDDVNCCSILPSSHSYNRIGYDSVVTIIGYDSVVPVVVIHKFISSLGGNVIPNLTQRCSDLYVLQTYTYWIVWLCIRCFHKPKCVMRWFLLASIRMRNMPRSCMLWLECWWFNSWSFVWYLHMVGSYHYCWDYHRIIIVEIVTVSLLVVSLDCITVSC